MRMIVVEGPDGSGKSTLAARLAEIFGYRLQSSEGRPKSTAELHARLARYAQMKDVVFDRHPIVSQVIYGQIRNAATGDNPTDEQIQAFYDNPYMFIIYCRAEDLSRHEVKAHDTSEHIAAVEANFRQIISLYDRWAMTHAHMIYRIGDKVEPRVIANMASSYLYPY